MGHHCRLKLLFQKGNEFFPNPRAHLRHIKVAGIFAENDSLVSRKSQQGGFGLIEQRTHQPHLRMKGRGTDPLHATQSHTAGTAPGIYCNYQSGDQKWDLYFPEIRDALIGMQSREGSWDGLGGPGCAG